MYILLQNLCDIFITYFVLTCVSLLYYYSGELRKLGHPRGLADEHYFSLEPFPGLDRVAGPS